MDAYSFYMSATMIMSLILFTCALVRVAVRNVKIPALVCWFMGLIQLGLAIFSMYTIFHVIILQDTHTNIIELNLTTIILSAVFVYYCCLFLVYTVFCTLFVLISSIIFDIVPYSHLIMRSICVFLEIK